MFSAELFGALADARAPTVALTAKIDNPREFLPRWMVVLYQVIRATSPVLGQASRRAFLLEDMALHSYFQSKRLDEAEHDEWLLSDLESIDISYKDAEDVPPNPFIAEMVGRQSYLIEFQHPAAYLGYIALLEGFPPTLGQVDALEKASGLPSDAFRCMRKHAEDDLGHRDRLMGVLSSLPEDKRAMVRVNALRCAELQRAALGLVLSEKEATHGRL